MILHKFSQSPFTHLQLQNTLGRLAPSDKILLCQDAVYAAHHAEMQTALQAFSPVYCITDDCQARGIKALPSLFKLTTYEQFVELSLECDQVVSW